MGSRQVTTKIEKLRNEGETGFTIHRHLGTYHRSHHSLYINYSHGVRYPF